MQSESNDQLRNDYSSRQTAPWFSGRLTKERLLTFPDHFFIVSGVAHNPFNPALEIEVTRETSREGLWRMIVGCRLDGRTFAVFLDKESFQADKDERLRMAWGLLAVP